MNLHDGNIVTPSMNDPETSVPAFETILSTWNHKKDFYKYLINSNLNLNLIQTWIYKQSINIHKYPYEHSKITANKITGKEIPAY